jgi:cellobiose-specific phosphotransferase system component IIC
MEVAIVFIILFAGLFTAISLNIFFRYRTNVTMSERVPLESLSEWYRSNNQAKAARSRGASLRWGGLIAGIGFGATLCLLLLLFNIGWIYDLDQQYHEAPIAITIMASIAFTILCGGAGMIGAYFLERKLDEKR